MAENSIVKEVGGKTYTITKFRPTDGRRIVVNYPLTALPKVGSYDANEEAMLLLMSHVMVHLPNGEKMALTNKTLIDNHVQSWEALAELEWHTLRFNCPFLNGDNVSTILDILYEVAGDLVLDVIARVIDSGMLKKEE